jgi:hypothetical protein
MRYRFTSWWSALNITVGFLIFVSSLAGAVFAFFHELPPLGLLDRAREDAVLVRVAVPVLLVITGLLVAAPFVVLGQVLQISLDQRRLLVRIHERLRVWERERRDERLQRRVAPPTGPATRDTRRSGAP